MSNPLLVFWAQLFGRREPMSRVPSHAHIESSSQASSTIFLVMRRMRAPLITLIVIFSVSVVGLTLIPGVDPDGQPARISLFESFYFMSYTATTIGFGELPWPFTPAQRLWVTFSIYLSVVGWAYAIGSLLTLLQDRSFRQALALRRFTRKVARLREPFLLVVGYGRAGELLAKDFDALGQQLVVIDESSDRIDALDLGSYHADIPGLVADAANPHHLSAAGLDHPFCAGVLALTNDDETNLAVTMTAALLRPDLPVVSRTVSATIAERMRAFGTPSVVNPFDRFGEHLRLALNAPASYQLLTWLEAGPGAELPERGHPPTDGRWVMCGYGRFGREVTADLRAAGLEVTIIEPAEQDEPEPGVIVGDASDPEVLARADLASAVGLVAGTDNDTTNLSMLATARRLNPDCSSPRDRIGRPAQPCSRPCRWTPCWCRPRWSRTRCTPRSARRCCGASSRRCRRGATSGRPISSSGCGTTAAASSPPCGRSSWTGSRRRPSAAGSPKAGSSWVTCCAAPRIGSGDSGWCRCCCSATAKPSSPPTARRCWPADDELLFAGQGSERRELESTLVVDSTGAYVLFDQHIPSSWVWRKLSRKNPTPSTLDDRGA